MLPVWFLLVPRDYLSTYLKIGTIADLIHYRMQNEKTVERICSCFRSAFFD